VREETGTKPTAGGKRGIMAEQINALLVHAQDGTLLDLTRILKLLDMKIICAGSCREASKLLQKQGAVDMVFAGTHLRDGGWADVLRLAQQSRRYVPVIVVSSMVDGGLYLDAIGRGAFDFVAPPFLASDLAHVVRSAIYKELLSVKQDMVTPPAA
jgi:DNA-binding NtrC family response regulator